MTFSDLIREAEALTPDGVYVSVEVSFTRYSTSAGGLREIKYVLYSDCGSILITASSPEAALVAYGEIIRPKPDVDPDSVGELPVIESEAEATP